MRCSSPLIWLLLTALVGAQSRRTSIQAQFTPLVTAVQAIYLSTNDSPNRIVALKVNDEGKLSEGTFTLTGGDGGVLINSDGSPVPIDALNSQDSIVREGHSLFVVNAGSSTLSMFKIDHQDPTHITLLGHPVDTMGDFPVSVAVSKPLSLVCVANGGASNGVVCFKFHPREGLKPDGVGLRSFGIAQKKPPLVNDDGPTDIFFSKDLRNLYAMIKGNPPSDTGFVSVFPIAYGQVGPEDVRSKPNGTVLLFGAIQVPGTNDNIFATDASFGAAILSVDRDNIVTTVAKTAIPNQQATCWVRWSRVTNSVFVTGPLSNNLVEMNVETSAIIQQYNIIQDNTGLIDIVVPGNFLYALSPGSDTKNQASVIVLDVSGGRGKAKQVQNFSIGGNVSSTAQGMAYYA